jgi:hypothetical protein
MSKFREFGGYLIPPSLFEVGEVEAGGDRAAEGVDDLLGGGF